MHKNSPLHIVRIGWFLLLLSATIIGWTSLSNQHDSQFWNIGSYTIPTLSAREHDDDDDEEEKDERREKRSEREHDDDDDENSIPSPIEEEIVPTYTEEVPAQPTINTNKIANSSPIIPIVSFDDQAENALQAFGFSSEEKQRIKSQFQVLSHDIALKYPSKSSQIAVYQNLINEATGKIQELTSFAETDTSTTFSSKIPSIQALISLANIQIKILQTPVSLPKQNTTLRTQIQNAPTTRVIQNTQPKKTTTAQTVSTPSVTPKKATPVVKTTPKVSTMTRAS